MLQNLILSVAFAALSARLCCAGEDMAPTQQSWTPRLGRTVRALQQASAAIGAALLLLTEPAVAEQMGAYLQQAPGLHGATAARSSERLPWDLRLLHVVAEKSGLGLTLGGVTLSDPLQALREGRIAFALPVPGATDNLPMRSIPYGERRDILIIPRGYSIHRNPTVALTAARADGMRIAVARASPMATRLSNASGTVVLPSDTAVIAALQAGVVELAIVESIAAFEMLAVERNHRFHAVTEPISVSPVVIGFAPGSIDAESLARIDTTIAAQRQQAAQWQQAELRRALMRSALASATWFSWLDLIGLMAFSFSGVIIARAHGWSLFGGAVLAGLPALGGGVMCDMIADRQPLSVVEAPETILTVLGVVLVSFSFLKVLDFARGRWLWLFDVVNFYILLRGRFRPLAALEVTDAIGIAASTVSGVMVAVMFSVEPLWLWGPIMAALSGAGGSILRDVVRSDPLVPAMRRSFYAEVCLIWGLFLSLGLTWISANQQESLLTGLVVTTVLGAFLTRILVWHWKCDAPSFARR
ncbi:TRIC cation channel family protein [Falsiroseomonas stagni]|nr:TRIC cation channel family protein [Falsiroseomonas stagni]